MTRYHSYDPASGHGLPHDPLKAIIAPRPIGWISSVDGSGRANLAPYSYFNMVAANPPILMFSSDGRKHTVSNIEQTGSFVFNLATRAQAQAMSVTSGVFPRGIDEFEQAGLDKRASDLVSEPRVAGAPVHMECRAIEVRQLTDIEGRALDNHMVLGQVVRVHIDEAFLVDGLFSITDAGTIARCGYRGDYAEVSDTFEMIRPVITTSSSADAESSKKGLDSGR